jgi:hypothetical protein
MFLKETLSKTYRRNPFTLLKIDLGKKNEKLTKNDVATEVYV